MKLILFLSIVLMPALTFAQAPVTGVLTMLTVKPEVDRTQFAKVMKDEVPATLKLYLDGKIQQWWARGDNKGVVFVLNCATVEDAKAITDTLPLSKNSFASFEYITLTPLTPLRRLLADPK